MDGMESRKFIEENGPVDLEFLCLDLSGAISNIEEQECGRKLIELLLRQIGSRCTRDTKFFTCQELLLIIDRC